MIPSGSIWPIGLANAQNRVMQQDINEFPWDTPGTLARK